MGINLKAGFLPGKQYTVELVKLSAHFNSPIAPVNLSSFCLSLLVYICCSKCFVDTKDREKDWY